MSIASRMRRVATVFSCACALGFSGLTMAASAAPAWAANVVQHPANASVTVRVGHTTVRAYRDTANDPCKTYESEDNLYVNRTLVAYVLFSTNFCYNNVIVTSKSLYFTPGVTTAGRNAGWASMGSQYYSWHCYVAHGSRRNCSGNEETEVEGFVKCNPLKPPCSAYMFPEILQEQNYKGQDFIEFE